MLIIIDARAPDSAIKYLKNYGEVFLLESSGIVYDSISGHPDIFLHQMGNLVIIAPNTPKDLIDQLKKHRIPFLRGKEKLGPKYPETAIYNAVSNSSYLIHQTQLTSNCILRQADDRKLISVSQAYTRCNLLSLDDDSFITSDKGIFKSLQLDQIEVYYFNPFDIVLNGQEYGFLGGAMGILENEVFILGNLQHYRDGKKLSDLLHSKNYKIHELYNGPLIDGGGLFFLE